MSERTSDTFGTIGYEFRIVGAHVIDEPQPSTVEKISAVDWSDARRQADEIHGGVYVRMERWDPEWLCWMTENVDRI